MGFFLIRPRVYSLCQTCLNDMVGWVRQSRRHLHQCSMYMRVRVCRRDARPGGKKELFKKKLVNVGRDRKNDQQTDQTSFDGSVSLCCFLLGTSSS